MKPFEALNSISVQEHIEKKSGLSYLAWAWAWGELKKQYPDSFYTIYENGDGWFYHTDGKTCWVKTGVTVVDEEYRLEHIEYLPVMDYRNKSIDAESVTSFDVNKAIQRSLTKAVARHGLGLYIYAGEDLPEDAPKAPKGTPVSEIDPRTKLVNDYCKTHKLTRKEFGESITPYTNKPLADMTPEELGAAIDTMAKDTPLK